MFNQVAPPLNTALRRLGREIGKTAEKLKPNEGAACAVEGSPSFQCSGFLSHWFQTPQVSDQRLEIFFRHARVSLVGHDRQKFLAIRSNSLGQGIANLLIRPVSQTCLFISGKISRVDLRHRNRGFARADVWRPLGGGVACAAAGQRKNILTPLDKITAGLLSLSPDRIKQEDEKEENQSSALLHHCNILSGSNPI